MEDANAPQHWRQPPVPHLLCSTVRLCHPPGRRVVTMARDMSQDATLRLIAELIDEDRATFGSDEQAWWAEHSVEPFQADVVCRYNDRRSYDIYVLATCSEYALVFHDGHEIFSVVPLLEGKCPAEGHPFDTIRDAVRWFLHARRAESV